MRTALLALLVLPLLAGRPAVVTAPQPSRVENHAAQACKVAMGSWVAGEIQIRPAGGTTDLARLKRQGEGYLLESGQAVDLLVLPDRNGLALQVTFAMASGSGGGSIYISQGRPGDPHTLNINEGPELHVDKGRYGRARDGAFVLIGGSGRTLQASSTALAAP